MATKVKSAAELDPRKELLALIPAPQRRKAGALLEKLLREQTGSAVMGITGLMHDLREQVLANGHKLEHLVIAHESDLHED